MFVRTDTHTYTHIDISLCVYIILKCTRYATCRHTQMRVCVYIHTHADINFDTFVLFADIAKQKLYFLKFRSHRQQSFYKYFLTKV